MGFIIFNWPFHYIISTTLLLQHRKSRKVDFYGVYWSCYLIKADNEACLAFLRAEQSENQALGGWEVRHQGKEKAWSSASMTSQTLYPILIRMKDVGKAYTRISLV
jgi:hypothetical protein